MIRGHVQEVARWRLVGPGGVPIDDIAVAVEHAASFLFGSPHALVFAAIGVTHWRDAAVGHAEPAFDDLAFGQNALELRCFEPAGAHQFSQLGIGEALVTGRILAVNAVFRVLQREQSGQFAIKECGNLRADLRAKLGAQRGNAHQVVEHVVGIAQGLDGGDVHDMRARQFQQAEALPCGQKAPVALHAKDIGNLGGAVAIHEICP